jgi:Ser/Thr protein kinase RdoA (MazF antagonist)
VLFRWVYGRFLRRSLSAAAVEDVGEFMARLHTHSETFQPPEGFSRPRWDVEGLLGAAVGLDANRAFSALSAEQREVIERMAAVVRRAHEQLGEGHDVFGMIHGDLHQGNYLFHKGEVRAIDFDFCGWGHYAYDIGVCFSAGQRHLEYPALRQAFLRGYKRQRALSSEEEALLDTFAAAFRMGHAMWLAARLDDPAFGGQTRDWIANRITQLRTFLESSS